MVDCMSVSRLTMETENRENRKWKMERKTLLWPLSVFGWTSPPVASTLWVPAQENLFDYPRPVSANTDCNLGCQPMFADPVWGGNGPCPVHHRL